MLLHILLPKNKGFDRSYLSMTQMAYENQCLVKFYGYCYCGKLQTWTL